MVYCRNDGGEKVVGMAGERIDLAMTEEIYMVCCVAVR